eukprot:g81037.t1
MHTEATHQLTRDSAARPCDRDLAPVRISPGAGPLIISLCLLLSTATLEVPRPGLTLCHEVGFEGQLGDGLSNLCLSDIFYFFCWLRICHAFMADGKDVQKGAFRRQTLAFWRYQWM